MINSRYTGSVLSLLFLSLFVVPEISADPTVSLRGEAGFLDVVDHRIAYSKDDPAFRYERDGGQDILFPFYRLSAELVAAEKHTVIFLYQPLELETRVEMPADFSLDGEAFSGSTLRVLYGFPFYRVSYLNTFVDRSRFALAAGGSLQIRNANTEFEARGGADGQPAEGFYRSADVGPVPLLKARARYTLPRGFWLETEIDGIYAPISYLNGSDNDTTGALLDASIRAGYTVSPQVEVFANARYLGGGATNSDPDNYSFNWLNVTSVSLGTALTLR
jgi:hypothetical protein